MRHGAASQQLGLGTHEGLYSCRWVDDALQHGVTETPRPSGPTRMLPKFRSHPFVLLLLLCSFMPKKTDVLLAAEDELERRGHYRSAAYLNDPTGTNHSLSSEDWDSTMSGDEAAGVEDDIELNLGAQFAEGNSTVNSQLAPGNTMVNSGDGGGGGGAVALTDGGSSTKEDADVAATVVAAKSKTEPAVVSNAVVVHESKTDDADEDADADADVVEAVEQSDNTEAIEQKDPKLFSDLPQVPRPPLKFDPDTGVAIKNEHHWDYLDHLHVIAPVYYHVGHGEFYQGIYKDCWPNPEKTLDQHGPSVLAKACIKTCHETVTYEEARKGHKVKLEASKPKSKTASAKSPNEKADSELARGVIFARLEPKMIQQMKQLGCTDAGPLPFGGRFKNLKSRKTFVAAVNKTPTGCGYEEKKELSQAMLGSGHRSSEKPRDKSISFLSRIYCTHYKCANCPSVKATEDLPAAEVALSTILEWRVDFEDVLDDKGVVVALTGTARGEFVYPHKSHNDVPPRLGLDSTRQGAMPFDEDFILRGVHSRFINHIEENYTELAEPPPGIQITNHMKGNAMYPHDHRLMEHMPSCRKEHKPLIDAGKHRESLLRFQMKFINDCALADQFTHSHCVPRSIVSQGKTECLWPTWPVSPKHVPHLYFDSVMVLMDGSQRVDGEIPKDHVPDPVPQPYHDDIAPVTLKQIIDLLPDIGHVMLKKDPALNRVAVELGLALSKGADGKPGKFYLPDSIQKLHEENKTHYKVNENPFLKEAELFLPGTIIIPLQDYRRIRFPEGEDEVVFKLLRKHCVHFAGCLTHAGDTHAIGETPPWHIAVHIYVNSIFHPRVPNTFSYNYKVIAKFQPAHVSSFKVDEQSKALLNTNKIVMDIYSKTLLNPKVLQTGIKHGTALVQFMTDLLEKAKKQMEDPAVARIMEEAEGEEEDNDDTKDSDYNDADGEEDKKPAAVKTTGKRVPKPAEVIQTGKRARKEKVQDDLGCEPRATKKTKHSIAKAAELVAAEEDQTNEPTAEEKEEAKDDEEEEVVERRSKKKNEKKKKTPPKPARGGGKGGRGSKGRGGRGGKK